nr:uncharacterized mitochondrial protein AtMg00810-like [Tanacetum cinerariifolium]
NLLKKCEIYNSCLVKTLIVPPNNLGHDLAGKPVNETFYRGKISPKESHIIVMKRILTYLKGTLSLGLWYPKGTGFDLKGYLDIDYAGCNMDRKRTSSPCQILKGKLVYRSAKKLQSAAMSSTEAEYVAAAGCCVNILWMKNQLSDFNIQYKMVPIFYDDTSAIAISNNPVLHSRTKLIDIRSVHPSFLSLVLHTFDLIPLGQKNTLAEYMILFGTDNRPPMLDEDLYDSWKSIVELYMKNIENERMILESVENDSLIWPTIEENGVTKTNKIC